MTRLPYTRVLIEVDLLTDLPTSINLVLPNGSSLTQQVMYESLPRFCKLCRVLGHTASTCNKGTGHKRKKQYHKALVHSSCSNPFTETTVVEKQQPYSASLHDELSIDPISAEVATIIEERPVSLGHKRTKPTEVRHSGAKHFASSNVVHISDDTVVEPPQRQYLTRSKVVAATNFGQQGRHDRVPKNSIVVASRHRSSSEDYVASSSLLFPLVSLYLWIFIFKGACSLCFLIVYLVMDLLCCS